MRAAAVVFSVVAVLCMIVAIADMVTDRPGARAGLVLRLAALVCFGAAVALGVASH